MTHWPIVLSSRYPSVWKITLRRGEETGEGMGKGGMKREGDEGRGKGKGRRHILFSHTSTTSALSYYFDLRNGLSHTQHGFSPLWTFTYACAFQTHKTPCRTHNIWMVSLMRILMCLLKCPEWLHVNSATPCVKRLQQTLTVYSTFKRFHIQFHCHNVYLASYTEES